MNKKNKIPPKKSLGQNFIRDHDLAKEIVSYLEFSERDTVLEVGPGKGVLTKVLLEDLAKMGRLIVCEKDARLIPELKKLSTDSSKYQVIEGDILKVNLAEILSTCSQKAHLIGNIPYYLTSDLLICLLNGFLYQGLPLSSLLMTLQKEVAERLTALPNTKAYAKISVIFQAVASLELLRIIDRAYFHPKPNVDSAVIKITFHDQNLFQRKDEWRHFQRLVKIAFASRRKTFLNNMKPFLKDFQLELDDVVEMLEKSGYAKNVRAEQIAVPDFIQLNQSFLEKVKGVK